MNQIKCSCQHCNGHIKFDEDMLRPGETQRVECPHCHLETVIYRPQSSTASAQHSSPKNNSSRLELFLFELTRLPILGISIIVLAALSVTAYLVVQAKMPLPAPKPPVISYTAVAPPEPKESFAPQATTENSSLPVGSKEAAKKTFPQPVMDFLLKHEGFSLKKWLDQLSPEYRQPYLINLADILTAANSKHLPEKRIEQVVTSFSEMWLSSVSEDAEAREFLAKKKQEAFWNYARLAFGMFISLMVFSLILVLLAIERNTRPIKPLPPSSSTP
jgi:hypothetical protein